MFETLRKWFEQHPLKMILSILGGVIALASFLKSLDAIHNHLDSMVQSGLQIDWTNKTVGTSSGLFSILFLVPILLLICFCLYVHALLTRSGKPQKKILDGMMRAVKRIGEQLLPEAHKHIKSFVNVKNIYLIDRNFNGEVYREYEISATKGSLHFWEITSGVENEADSVSGPDEINFKIRDDSGKGVSYLPTTISPKKLATLAFFLPRIEPEEGTPRKIVVTYKWPGMFKHLKIHKYEPYSWVLESVEPITSAEFHFYLEEGDGHILEGEVAGPAIGVVNQSAKHPEKQWRGIIYSFQDAPGNTYKLDLRLKKT